MAEPPLVPFSVMNSTPPDFFVTFACVTSQSLDSAAPTNPTGKPRIAAGFGQPSSNRSIRWNSAVGALPMATTAPSRSSRHNSTAAAERVVPSSLARSPASGLLRVTTTRLSDGRNPRVMPAATMVQSQRIGAPPSSASAVRSMIPGEATRSPAISGMPQAWMIRTAISAVPGSNRSRSAASFTR